MAMTKSERAAMDALRVRCALAWPPEPPAPVDLKVAKEASGAIWLHLWSFNSHSGRVPPGVTNGTSVCSAEDYTDAQLDARHGGGSRVRLSQGPGGPWYATKADALRALHFAVALACAKKLSGIAMLVEAALSSLPEQG